MAFLCISRIARSGKSQLGSERLRHSGTTWRIFNQDYGSSFGKTFAEVKRLSALGNAGPAEIILIGRCLWLFQRGRAFSPIRIFFELDTCWFRTKVYLPTFSTAENIQLGLVDTCLTPPDESVRTKSNFVNIQSVPNLNVKSWRGRAKDRQVERRESPLEICSVFVPIVGENRGEKRGEKVPGKFIQLGRSTREIKPQFGASNVIRTTSSCNQSGRCSTQCLRCCERQTS